RAWTWATCATRPASACATAARWAPCAWTGASSSTSGPRRAARTCTSPSAMPSRRRALRFLLAALALCGAARAALAQDALVERILAVVEGRPVLLSEVRLVQALRGLDEKAALEELIDERL